MNKTVRDVGGLILAIILMVSMYGVYKGGTTDTGHLLFNRMTRDVGRAFGKTDTIPVKSWNLGQGSLHEQATYDRLFRGVPKKDWRKGVTIQGYKGQKFYLKDNNNGKYTMGYNGDTTQDTSQNTQQYGGFTGLFNNDVSFLSKMKDGRTELQDPDAVNHPDQVESPTNAQYDPNTRTMKLSNFQ